MKINLSATSVSDDCLAGGLASAFVAARQSGTALKVYPGEIPSTKTLAYHIQDKAIALWPEAPLGWKVALVGPTYRADFGDERLSGPVFHKKAMNSPGTEPLQFEIFTGGFAAVEAEFVAVMARDAPAFGRLPTPQEASELVASLHIGVETAGSPFAAINDFGPMVVVSDFGNNAGVLLGHAITDWQNRSLESLKARMFVDDALVGEGSAAAIPGGPMAAVAFLIHHLEQRGKPLRAGQLISTGATTGIHLISAGARITADFGGDGSIHARPVAMAQTLAA
ncbi:MAG: 2-keto-4-pentenoate hydratase [Beijerinckiaceae bacterium]